MMNLFSCIRCIFCLVKCSKYLYFAKKLLCFMTVAVAGLALICSLGKNSGSVAKIRRMF